MSSTGKKLSFFSASFTQHITDHNNGFCMWVEHCSINIKWYSFYVSNILAYLFELVKEIRLMFWIAPGDSCWSAFNRFFSVFELFLGKYFLSSILTFSFKHRKWMILSNIHFVRFSYVKGGPVCRFMKRKCKDKGN